MTRLIDADKLYPDCLTKNGRLAISQNQIANAPTVEVYSFEQVQELVKLNKQLVQDIESLKRPQGEWINHRNDYGHNIADCSLCGKATQWHDEDEDGIPKYCWFCGADMRGEIK